MGVCGRKQFQGIGCCSIAAMGALAVVAAYQLGALEHLPDPPGELFDSDRIVSAKESRILGIPDALVGIASYTATCALAKAAAHNCHSRALRRAVGVKVWIDVSGGLFKAAGQWPHYNALCSWCLGVTAASVVNVILFHVG